MNDLLPASHEFMTVRELAELLRIKERKVYDLAASGEVPCSRATGKLLFPTAEIRAWINGAKSGGVGPLVDRPAIFLGSHDPLLDWAIRQSRCGLATFNDGSLDGLKRFQSGEGIAAGLHLYDASEDRWNVPAASQAAKDTNAVLVKFASRNRGLVYRPDDQNPKQIADIAGRRMAPRQHESGTWNLFVELALSNGLDTGSIDYAPVARTEDDAVQMVQQGEADVTFGLQSIADMYGLGFLPVVEEQFDILIDRKAWFDAPMQKLLQFFETDQFKHRAESFSGYDSTGIGAVVWNA